MKKIKDKNLYYVGGVVRDEIINTQSFDIDYCYEGNAIEFSKKFNIIKINPAFGTVKVLIEDSEIDIASTRQEIYPKAGHLPEVTKIGCSLKEDLQRRDFTINALAKNTLNGKIIDYFNGINDIHDKKLKVLHNKSFIDDPTRIIRGLKFRVRFDFELDENTKKLQEEYLNNINYNMSYHRLKKELKETFNLNKEVALKIFIEENMYKLLGKNLKKPKYNNNIEKIINKYHPKNIWLIYMGLFDLTNIELTAEEKNIIDNYSIIKTKSFNNKLEIYKAFLNVPIESLLLYAITINETVIAEYIENLSKIKILLTGKHLLKMGIKSGEIYKEIFDYVLEKKLEKKVSTLEDEIEWVRTKYL